MTQRVEVIGAKEVLKALREIDPEARKQFGKDAKAIAQPIITEAQSKYPERALSGMRYRWLSRGRQILPWDARKARRGVTVKVDAGRRSDGVVTAVEMSWRRKCFSRTMASQWGAWAVVATRPVSSLR